MGNYSILIEGIGSHQNGAATTDADLLVNQFIETLRGAGHTIEHASFRSHGRRETLTLIGKKKGHPPSLAGESTSAADDGHVAGLGALEEAATLLLAAQREAHAKLDDILAVVTKQSKKSGEKKGKGAAASGEEKLKAEATDKDGANSSKGGVETPADPSAGEVNPEAESGGEGSEPGNTAPDGEEGTDPA